MWGEPRVAAECTGTEREFGWCARPTVRPGRTVHDARDHGDGSDTRPRGRRTSGSLTETRVRDWQSWPKRFDGSAGRHMTPCPLDGTDHRARHVLAACIESDGPVDADGDQALVIDDARATRPSCPVARRHGPGTRPPGRSCAGHAAAGARGRGAWATFSDEPDVTWRVNGLAAKEGIEPSGRSEQPPARRPRVVSSDSLNWEFRAETRG